jgi:hypothetical protein
VILVERARLHAALLDTLRGSIDGRAPAATDQWFARLSGIRDPSIRARLLTERLIRSDTHYGFALLRGLLDLASDRDPGARQLLLDLTSARPLAETVGYEPTRRIYKLAAEYGRNDVARLFLSPEAMNPRAVSQHFLANQNQHLGDASLGWRKKLARGSDRLRLDRLVFDRNPDVIRILLANPRITLRDVVRVAAMRPANPAALTVVFQSRKWVARYRVKVALACNPWSPIDISLACLPHLMSQDLRYVARSEKLTGEVRDAATKLLRAAR